MDFTSLIDYSSLQTVLLDYLVGYTYPVLAVVVLVAAIGLPLPTSLLILTAAALAGQGNVSIIAVIAITATFASLGDIICYTIGSTAARRIEGGRFVSKESMRRGRESFERNADSAIFLSRFLFTPMGTPVNLLSAAYKVEYRRFIALVVGGELVWGIELGLIGYFVGTYVEELYQLITNLTMALALLVVVVWLIKKSR